MGKSCWFKLVESAAEAVSGATGDAKFKCAPGLERFPGGVSMQAIKATGDGHRGFPVLTKSPLCRSRLPQGATCRGARALYRAEGRSLRARQSKCQSQARPAPIEPAAVRPDAEYWIHSPLRGPGGGCRARAK